MRLALAILSGFIALALAGALPAQAQRMNWPDGSWQASCRAPRMNGRTFSAECRADNGSWRRSAVDLNRCPGGLVSNRNGSLFCEGGNMGGNFPGGSWSQSCHSARMNGDVLHANCSTGSGYRQTSFAMRNCPGWSLANSNGNLVCQSGGGGWQNPGHFPGGSWQNSCGNASLHGTRFSAQCSTGSGYRSSTIDLRQCPSRLVANRDGFLVCGR